MIDVWSDSPNFASDADVIGPERNIPNPKTLTNAASRVFDSFIWRCDDVIGVSTHVSVN